MNARSAGVVVALALLLGGCASGVVRDPATAPTIAGAKVEAVKVSAVSVSLSPEAQKLLAENLKFNQETLAATVRRALDAKGLLASDSAFPVANIVVRDFRVRSSFSAVMFGIMAGTDSLSGDVIINDRSGKAVRKFNISASYGLGGIAGGQDDVRLNWLYEKFAEHTLAELSGEARKD